MTTYVTIQNISVPDKNIFYLKNYNNKRQRKEVNHYDANKIVLKKSKFIVRYKRIITADTPVSSKEKNLFLGLGSMLL